MGYGLPVDASGFYAYVACQGQEERDGAIHVFDISGSRWRAVQTFAAVAPGHLELCANRRMLYAFHNVGLWDGRPRGGVSAFAICPNSGRLTLCNSQPLSLSATHPTQGTITAPGDRLVVAAQSGAIYNVLPLSVDGTLLPPSAIRKEVGVHDGKHFRAASPIQVLCHPDGQSVIALDDGLEALSIFSLTSESIDLCGRSHLPGRRQIVLSPCGAWVYALRSEDGALDAYRYDRLTKKISLQNSYAGGPHGGPALIAMHPSGRFLLITCANSLTVLGIDGTSGVSSILHSIRWSSRLQALAFTPDGASFAAIEQSSRRLIRYSFDPISGMPGDPRFVAQVDSASFLAFAAL